ncbi:hypothetical protein B9Z55_022630 [Caenorhabditis nigoni]|uniref:Uncharacterized protein n=2 Tax=Caenorhabditis nigoni TaxID=1611254 RepID=A0A2G5SL56_9PELO|nr:hypothetical protein B9Z55_022630 [Caenorhabditis nigoni]
MDPSRIETSKTQCLMTNRTRRITHNESTANKHPDNGVFYSCEPAPTAPTSHPRRSRSCKKSALSCDDKMFLSMYPIPMSDPLGLQNLLKKELSQPKTNYKRKMQIAKTVTDITYNPTLQDSPLSHWRHRKFVGITYGSDECFYCISDYDGKGTVMVFNQTSNTFCARYRLKIDGVPSFVISRSPNYFWILMEEDRGRSRKNIRMYSIQMDGRFLVGVVPSNYRQSVRGSYRAMATDEDVLLVFHGSNPVMMDIWHPTCDQKTIRLMDVRFKNFLPTFTIEDNLYAFSSNNIGQCDCSKIWEIDLSSSTDYPRKTEMACAGVEIPTGIFKDRHPMLLSYKTLTTIKDNGTGGYDIWSLAIANQTWTKCSVAIDSENCIHTVHKSGVVYLYGTNRNTGECSF